MGLGTRSQGTHCLSRTGFVSESGIKADFTTTPHFFPFLSTVLKNTHWLNTPSLCVEYQIMFSSVDQLVKISAVDVEVPNLLTIHVHIMLVQYDGFGFF